MTIQEGFLLRFAMFILGVCGFFIARYIYKSKKENTPLLCPIGFDCNGVVNSKYSKIFGVPVEVFGMIYYCFMSVAYFVLLFVDSSILPAYMILLLALAPISAFLFSLYLLYVQIFLIKKGCSWCYISSLLCILIFVFTLYAYDIMFALESFLN